MSDTLRLFFALWPNPGFQSQIHRRTREVVRRCGGRPVPISKLHLTMLFLGSQPGTSLSVIMDAAASLEPVSGELRLARIGAFPRARVLWLGPERTPVALSAAARRLRTILTAAGIACDRRPFRAHVTIARRIGTYPQASIKPLVWRYRGISLVASEPTVRGSQYRIVAEWPSNPLPPD